MRRELLFITLLITSVHPDFAPGAILLPDIDSEFISNRSERIDQRGPTPEDTVAQFKLGYAYQFGKGVDKTSPKRFVGIARQQTTGTPQRRPILRISTRKAPKVSRI